MPKVFRHRNRDEFGGGGRNKFGGHQKFGGYENRNSGSSNNEGRIKKGFLEESVMSYYRQVSTTLEAGFDEQENSEAKSQFISNVVDALKDEGVKVSQNQTVSRILEFLFTHSPPRLLPPVFVHFCTDLTTVVFDAFASHIFQALIQYLPLMFQRGDAEDDEEFQKSLDTLKESVETLCTFMDKHLTSDDVMTHVYGSHVLRSLLEVLGGVPVRAEIVRSRMSRKTSYKEVGHGPEVNKKVLKQFSDNNKDWLEKILEKIIRQCNYGDHLSDQNFCPLLQTVLLILHKTRPQQYEELASTIIDGVCADTGLLGQGGGELRLPMLAQSQVGSYLLELLVSLAQGGQLKGVYEKLFKGRLLHYAVHPCANYVLQRLLTTITCPDLMTEVYTDMKAYIEDILAVSHCGLVTALAEGLAKNSVCQQEFLEVVMTAFHCWEPPGRRVLVVPLLAAFSTYEVYQGGEGEAQEGHQPVVGCSIHGSLLLQRLVTFSDPRVTQALGGSLLALGQSELVCLASDKCGCHCLSAFMDSPSVGGHLKDKFVNKLKGAYVNMATNIHGSRFLENIWKHLTLQQRTMVAEDLCQGQERLEGDRIGKYVYRNLALNKFMNRRKEWDEIQGATAKAKKKQMLNHILDGQQGIKKKKQKKSAENNENEVPVVKEDTSQQKEKTLQSQQKKDKKKNKSNEAGEKSKDPESVQSESKVDSDEHKSNKRKRKKEKRKMIRGPHSEEDLQSLEHLVKKKKQSEVQNLKKSENISRTFKKKKKKKGKL